MVSLKFKKKTIDIVFKNELNTSAVEQHVSLIINENELLQSVFGKHNQYYLDLESLSLKKQLKNGITVFKESEILATP